MTKLYFQEPYAWNLYEAAVQDNIYSEPPVKSYLGHMRIEGLSNGIITRSNRLKALQMLVVAEQTLINIDIPPIGPLFEEKHVDWSQQIGSDRSLMLEPSADEIDSWGPFIRRSLENTDFHMTEPRFKSFVELYRQYMDWQDMIYGEEGQQEVLNQLSLRNPQGMEETLRVLDEVTSKRFALDPRGEDKWLKDAIIAVSKDCSEWKRIRYLATRGVPTFGKGPQLNPVSDALASETSESTETVLRVYFENAIKTPAPTTLTEALKLRENTSVQEWRAQVAAWSDLLSTGRITAKEVESEINDANRYLEGAIGAANLIPSWAVFITAPLSIVAKVVPELGPLGFVTITASLLKAYALIAGHAATKSGSTKYPWLMVSTNKN